MENIEPLQFSRDWSINRLLVTHMSLKAHLIAAKMLRLSYQIRVALRSEAHSLPEHASVFEPEDITTEVAWRGL